MEHRTEEKKLKKYTVAFKHDKDCCLEQRLVCVFEFRLLKIVETIRGESWS